MQMQGLSADSDAIRDTQKLVESFVPMRFAGSLDVSEGLQFGGLYQFPGKDAATVYPNMKDFLRNSMQSQVGEDKPYSSITVEEGVRKVGRHFSGSNYLGGEPECADLSNARAEGDDRKPVAGWQDGFRLCPERQ